MKMKLHRDLGAGLLLLLIVGCASTELTKSWRLPETGPLQFEKIMALVLVQDKFARQAGEDELVRQIKKTEAVASFRLVPEEELDDETSLREAIASEGIDGIVVMRPVYDQKEVNYVPGTYSAPYYSFWGYYSWAYPVVYSPGYYRTDRLVGVETNIYDANTGKLVYSAVSQSKNPSDVTKLVAATAKAVRKAMKRYGFIA